ncbi:heterokaryon incompatibility protein-domain-containing protein [Podospora aff. communis PSN243]|uniref:Heterokaryon incompatibility protein-domain-containing protein n=1 Tax=Podospora aff. communis PSN243 TaxID=3040156 RepID=A0AAV9GUI9_9PEZI|nr:heterokaryon incompatibility protein-domain-containing protein [Podospora aff. communis PSN243]
MTFYQPLQQRQLRLLRLLPGKWSDPIPCSLEVVSLDANPSYAALSYTWGDATDTVPITLDGQSWHVTRSLHDFFRQIRELLSGTTATADNDVGGQTGYATLTGLRLWADALCINQVDTAEKQMQIPLMGTVYRKVEMVHVWLGVSPRGPGEDARLKAVGDAVFRAEGWLNQQATRAALEGIDPGDVAEAVVGEVRVIQEAALASQLRLLLRYDGRYQATVPHDMLYGLLGLAQAGDVALPDSLLPDYTKPLHVVYREYTTALIRATSDIRFIFRTTSGLPDNPSWVPDFRSPVSQAQEERKGGAIIPGLDADDITVKAQVSRDDSILTVRMRPVGYVVKFYRGVSRPATTRRASVSKSLREMEAFLCECARLTGVSYDEIFQEWALTSLLKEAASNSQLRKTLMEYGMLTQNLYRALVQEIGLDDEEFQTHVGGSQLDTLIRLATQKWVATGDGRLFHVYRIDVEFEKGDRLFSLGDKSWVAVLREDRCRAGKYVLMGDALARREMSLDAGELEVEIC